MCDYEYEPDYLTNIQEIIAEEVENRLSDEIRQIRTDNRAANECIKELRSSNDKLQHDIKSLQEKMKDEIAHAMRHSWVGFDAGDFVYFIDYRRPWVACEECGETGKVAMEYKGEKTQIKCPKCEGMKQIMQEKEYYIESGYVSQIKINNWISNGYTLKDSKLNHTIECMYVRKKKTGDAIQYHPIDNKLYKTLQEAQDALKVYQMVTK